ncbi:MAG: trypsin-like peptidase domain-containing protein [Nanoarchaeota archaeon]|nr:trypsin-like peptidase domain-containing protein [Nanoarchaeota archaeon]
MKRHHKVIIGSFSTLVIISIVAIAILLNGIIVKQNIENAALKSQISQLQNLTEEKINEIATEVIDTKKVLGDEIYSLNLNIESTTERINKLQIQSGEDFSGIIENVIGSIVIIRTLNREGSGFFISDGYIATNQHIIEDPDGEISKVVQVVTNDNKAHPAVIVGYIKELDLALIKTTSGYGELQLANSDKVRIGETVLAIGSPEGLSFSATDGIISAVGRSGFGTTGTYIQTNAQLNPGNSGGPLLNREGKVVGMNNFKIAETEGLGFALESNRIREGINAISEALLNETLINY